ncbi:MAG: glycoside hydrolase, partial [Rhodospirillales bacterium]|nr:glycoside hydrolase [Rhodospirillales bacterium]
MRTASFLPPLAALAVIAFLSFSLWAWLGRPVPLPDVPGGRLQCLSYTPSHDGSSPLDADFTTSPEQVKADMARMKPITGCIRTYSSLGAQGEVVAAAAEAGIMVQVGIWISADDKANTKEIDHALAIAAAHPGTAKNLIVGNEVLLRREMTGEKLAGIIRSVKARTDLPVTYADIFEFWRRNPAVAAEVDVVTIHVLPHWDDPTPVGIDSVQAHVRGIIDTARATFPGKAMQIGEIGWPSAGRTRGAAAPSLVNEARFLREFALQADSIGLPYNIIEGVDQPWKRLPEGTVGGYWGVLDKDRNPKFSLTGPVSEWPNWPMAAAFSAAGALLAIGAALVLCKGMQVTRWFATAAAGAATATALWVFGNQAMAAAIGLSGALWGGYLW